MNRLRFPRKRGSCWVTAAALEGDGIGTIHLCRVISRANLLPSRPMGRGYVRLNVAGKTREQLEEVFNAARAIEQLHVSTNDYANIARDIVQDELL